MTDLQIYDNLTAINALKQRFEVYRRFRECAVGASIHGVSLIVAAEQAA